MSASARTTDVPPPSTPVDVVRRIVRRIATVTPHVDTSLWSAFRADPLLRWTTLVLVLGAWLPLFLTPFLPFADQGINTACSDLLWDTARGHAPAAAYYQIQ